MKPITLQVKWPSPEQAALVFMVGITIGLMLRSIALQRELVAAVHRLETGIEVAQLEKAVKYQ